MSTNSLPLGKLSGRHAFISKLSSLGFELDEESVNDAFKRFKALADKKKQVDDEDIVALVTDQKRVDENCYQLASVQLQYVSNGYQGAIVSVNENKQQTHTSSSIGSGSIQAIYNAVDDIFKVYPKLMDYEIQSITAGEDAQAQVRVSVRDQESGKTYSGIGVDFDVLQASAKAYIQASEKIKRKGEAK